MLPRLFHRQWLHLFDFSLNVTDPNINLITVMCPYSTVFPRVSISVIQRYKGLGHRLEAGGRS